MARKKMMDALASFFKTKNISLKDEEIKELENKLGDNVVEKLEEILAPLIKEEKLRASVIEAILPIYEAGEAHGETMAASVPAAVQPKAGEVSDEKDKKIEELKVLSQQALSAVDKLKEAISAKSEVEAETGDLGVLDSSEEYYKAGCEKLGVDTKGIKDSELCATFRAAAKFSKQKSGKVGDSVDTDVLSDSCKKIKL